MEQQQSLFEHKLLSIGSIIENNGRNYQIIGHGFGVDKEEKGDGLPLNDIDIKIIDYILNLKDDTIFNSDFHVRGFNEDAPHVCDDTCTPIGPDIEQYIDNVINEINLSSNEFEGKWKKDRDNYILGFYRPFHFFEDWGIFIKATGQARRTISLKRSIENDQNQFGNPSIEACYLISKTFTFFHEFYHHKIESLAIKFELITRQAYYTKGFHCLYCNTLNTDRCLEEAFAHTYAYFETYDNLRPYLSQMGMTGKQLRQVLKKLIIRESPPGYNLAEKIISANNKELAKKYEYYFFEALLKFSFRLNNGFEITSINDESAWKNFKHATHPILFTENDVTYLIDVDDVTSIQVTNFIY
jgi:hypothetical protein